MKILYIFITIIMIIFTPVFAIAYGLTPENSDSSNETPSGITQEQTINSINLPTNLPNPSVFLNLIKQKIISFLTSKKTTEIKQDISKKIGDELEKNKEEIKQRIKEEAKKQIKKKGDEAKEELQKRIEEETPRAKNWLSQTLESFKKWLNNKIRPVPKH